MLWVGSKGATRYANPADVSTEPSEAREARSEARERSASGLSGCLTPDSLFTFSGFRAVSNRLRIHLLGAFVLSHTTHQTRTLIIHAFHRT